MPYESILFKRVEDSLTKDVEESSVLLDLNLNQIIDSITVRRQEYNLRSYFCAPLGDVDAIKYRQEVSRDLEDAVLLGKINSFAEKMVSVRRYQAMIDNLEYNYHKKGWFLEAVLIYCNSVACLMKDLRNADLKSRGLLGFREYLVNYTNSDAFLALHEETERFKSEMASVNYCVHIKENCIKVRRYESETDYSEDVEKTFEKFKQYAVKDYRATLPVSSGMNHVEAAILDYVAKLYPEVFSHLDEYFEKNRGYIDGTIAAFDREIQFYCAYLEYIAKHKEAGLKFCYPQISDTVKEVYDFEGYDLALASKCVSEKLPVVCNDFHLNEWERIIVVSGPNQGGKTTFARTFGQLHYLACLGCPVPGREARLFLFDRIFTHFEREENIKNLRGKLQDDLIRIHNILSEATPKSLIIVNEIFTSTSLKDAILLGKKILDRIAELDSLCVCVTFIDEWTTLSGKIVSMVSTVVLENPSVRTFKIVRKPADGLAYALSIAEKYHVTYDCLKERIKA